MNKYSKALLADAKQEYTNQLISILTIPVYEGIKSIYEGALEVSNKNIQGRNFLKTFQILLSQTPTWEPEKLEIEYSRIKKNTRCDYLEDLVTAVFVAHTKILSSIKSNSQQKSIDLNIPTGPHFIHKVYIEAARNFWKQPYLFNHKYNPLDLQRNLNDAEKIIKESILETIRKLLPVKDVLKEYLGSNFDEDNYSISHNDDVTSVVSENTKANIRKLLKYEMDNTLLINKDDKFSKININDDISLDSSLLVDTKTSQDTPFNLNEPSKIENDIEKTISNMKKSLANSVISNSNTSIDSEQLKDDNKQLKENNDTLEESIENIKNKIKESVEPIENSKIISQETLEEVKSNVLEDSPINIEISEKVSQSKQSITTQSILNNEQSQVIEPTVDSIPADIENDSNNIDIDALADTSVNSNRPTNNSPALSISSNLNDTTTILNTDTISIADNQSIDNLIKKYDTITSDTQDKTLEEARSIISKLSKKSIQGDTDAVSHHTQYNLNDTLSPDTFDNRSTSERSIKSNVQDVQDVQDVQPPSNDTKSIRSTSSRKSILENVPEDFSFFQDAAEF